MGEVNLSVKLSELKDETLVSEYDSNTVITAKELRERISTNSFKDTGRLWYTVSTQEWIPSADDMVYGYIENESNGKHEEWYDNAFNALTKETVNKIQELINNDLSSKSVRNYWDYLKAIKLDTGEEQ